MAFSTQKDFFHVPFMNETVTLECKRACVKLKSYDSNIDDRSWARDESKRSKFLSDLVTCQFPVTGMGGEDGMYGEDGEDGMYGEAGVGEVTGIGGVTGMGGVTRTGGVASGGGMGGKAGGAGMGGKASSGGLGGKASSTGMGGKAGGSGMGGKASGSGMGGMGGMAGSAGSAGGAGGGAITRGSANRRDVDPSALSGGDALHMTGGDSLLQCANVHLAEYQKVMNIKVSLEKQLDTSNERLRTANNEINKIKEILTSKLDSNTTKEFYNKIQKFISAGKFTKNEENEMLQIHQKMESMHKAYEILQAENMYLKRLIEKLSDRVKIEQIPQDPEKSTNVQFLQNEVNKLRQECRLLRSMEDDYSKLKQQAGKNMGGGGGGGLSDQDAENIKTIINERNALREKCKSFKNLEKDVQELEQKYREANKMNGDITGNLNSQASHIRDLECECQKMQMHYEQQMETACFMQQCLKAQIEELKEDIVSYKCQAQRAEVLQSEVSCLRKEVMKRDLALNDYDCQYKQLMDVVNELQAIKLQCLQDNHTQTCKNQTDDLAFFTCATLDEIMKEMKKKGCAKTEFDGEFGDGDGDRDAELTRLKHEFDALKKDRDNMCADALKRIQELEDQNSCLESMFECGEAKMCKMLDKIDCLDCELNKNANDLKRSNNELNEARKLVEDISNMQMANQKLSNAVGAINSRDDEKTIDDLRRQLEEEMAKLKKCQCILEQRDKENKCLKEFNKKLLKDKCEMKKLLQNKTGEDDGIDKLKKGNDTNDQDINGNDKNKRDTKDDDDDDDDDEKVVDDRKFQSISDRKEALDGNYLEKKSRQDKDLDKSKQDKDRDKSKQDKDIDKSYRDEDLDKSYRDKDLDKSYRDKDIDKSYRDEDLNKSYRDKDLDKSYRDKDIDKSYQDKDIDKLYQDKDIDKSYRGEDLDKSYRDKDLDKSYRDKDLDKLYRDKDIDKSYRDKDIDKSYRDKDIDKSYQDKDIDKSIQDKDNDKKSIHDKDKKSKQDKDKDKLKPKDNSVIRKQAIQAQALQNVTVDKQQHEQQQHEQQQQQQYQRSPKKDTSKTIPEGKVFDEFVNKNADNLKITFNKGRCMEKELRKILDEFVQECGFCFSRLVNPKSKFYTICHKLCHSGIRALPFRELAYLHKKIFAQAEQLLPGCLLDMILKEHREDVQCALMLPPTIEGMVGGGEQKCCHCRKELCCNKSEEILEEKCSRLEKDIEIARDLLESLKTLPIGNSPPGDFVDMLDPNDCPTYRATSPVPKVSSKQLKKLKSRLLKNPDIFRKQ